jgi:hypothetical protein
MVVRKVINDRPITQTIRALCHLLAKVTGTKVEGRREIGRHSITNPNLIPIGDLRTSASTKEAGIIGAVENLFG